MAEMTRREEITKAGLKWLGQQYESGRDHFPKIFNIISRDDYILLMILIKRLKLHEAKVYLKDISEELLLPMKELSPRVQRLADMGHVIWKHDRAGTFICLTDSGMEAMAKQEERLIDFIEATVKEYGLEKFETLNEYRGELNRTMEKILSEQF